MPKSKRKTVELIAYGTEPVFTEQDYSQSELASFLSFYNYNSNHDNFKNFTLEYVETNCPELLSNLTDIPKTLFKATLGALCRMITRGYPPSEYIYDKINTQLVELIEYAGVREKRKAQTPVAEKPKPKTAADNLAIYIDGVEAYTENCITTGAFVPKDWSKFILLNKIKSDAGLVIADYFNHLLEELKESNEGYDLVKKDFDKYVGIVQSIVDVFGNIPSHRAERKRKARPIDKAKVSAKMKYMAEFPELGLVSKLPVDIIGAKYVLLYNTKYKKVQLITAVDELSIRGSTIYGIDAESSQSKTVRQPKIIPAEFMGDDIAYILGSFRNLKTKSGTPTGAMNENIVILRTWHAGDVPTQKFVQF